MEALAVQSRRAIEALRAGVPNRDAVHALGNFQVAIEKKFSEQLTALSRQFTDGQGVPGLLVAGDFGSGKSHLLEHLQAMALEHNYVCSKVVVSKGTPLHDPGKVLMAAVESARVPGWTGSALTQIGQSLRFNEQSYTDFYQWVNNSGLSSRFPATVFVYERMQGGQNPEVSDQILRFWSGAKLGVGELRSWLRELRSGAVYRIDKASAKELALQRYQFLPRLMIAAGYSGWIILVDEVELIGQYSLQQRARSYAAAARLLGRLEGSAIPGLATVLAITTDFTSRVLDAKNDDERISRYSDDSADGQSLLVSQAERGMRTIRNEAVRLEAPGPDTIALVYDKVRTLHAQAYSWEPSKNFDFNRTVPIRRNIKRWINEWDLTRLYPEFQPDTVMSDLKQDYAENPELEKSPEESEPKTSGEAAE